MISVDIPPLLGIMTGLLLIWIWVESNNYD